MGHSPFQELYKNFFGSLESIGIDYFAYGGVAVAVWGDPRITQDVDALVTVSEGNINSLLNTLKLSGFRCSDDAEKTFAIDGWLRLTFKNSHADISLGKTPFDESAMKRRHRVTLFGMQLWVVSAEDLILYKILAYRFKDLADTEGILIRQRGKLDIAYLNIWAEEIAKHTNKFEVPQKLNELFERTNTR